jgi:hypothetical protein
MAPGTRTIRGASLVGLAVYLASAEARAVTITFDAGAGRPPSYSEAGITVVPADNPEDHVHLGDNDGDGSPDLMLHPLCCSSPYQFTFSGGRFTPVKLHFTLKGGTHTFTSSSGATVTPTASGTVTFPPDGWRGITLFTWRDDGVSLDEQGVIDNLQFCPGDCDDGNACTTDRCEPDDPGAGPDGCTHVPNEDPCDDGVFCNGPDRCSGGFCRVHAGDPCTVGPECATTCNEAAANCFVAAGTPCTDDGNVCTDDRCDGAGVCAHLGGAAGATFPVTPPSGEGEDCGEDGDACTTDVCRSGECVHERLVEPSDCTLLQDPLRQALSLGTQVDGLITFVGDAAPKELVGTLARIRQDLTAAARALGGKSNGGPVMRETPLRHRVKLALMAVRRTPQRIAAFLNDLARPGVRPRLDANVAGEVERRARVLNQGVRTLKADLRRLRRVFATFTRERRPRHG